PRAAAGRRTWLRADARRAEGGAPGPDAPGERASAARVRRNPAAQAGGQPGASGRPPASPVRQEFRLPRKFGARYQIRPPTRAAVSIRECPGKRARRSALNASAPLFIVPLDDDGLRPDFIPTVQAEYAFPAPW